MLEEFQKEIKECGQIRKRTYIRTQCKNCSAQIEYDKSLRNRHKGHCRKCSNIARKGKSLGKALDLVGQKFGHLTVISRRENSKSGNTRWFCRCSCGNSNIVSGGMLNFRKVNSCGCVHGLTPQEYIKSKIKICPITGCWIWQGSLDKNKYGQVQWMTESWRSHRLAYAVFIAPIPKKMFVCHNCPKTDNPSCCNPNHLFLGTNSDNIKDMYEKKRVKSVLNNYEQRPSLTPRTLPDKVQDKETFF